MSKGTANPRPKRMAGSRAAAANARRESATRDYLKSMHKSPRGFRTEFAYRECLKDVPDAGDLLREAETELAADLERAAAAQTQALAQLRAARRRASPLMVAICRMDGFEPATVAAAVLPVPIHTHASDGHPWLPTGSPAHRALGLHFDTSGSSPFRNRVTLRKAHDPRGALAVVQRRGTLEVEGRIGDAWIETNAGKVIITLTRTLPETILAAMPGRPVSQLIDHPLLADPAYVVRSAHNERGRAVVVFACPNVPCLGWHPHGAGPPYLHSDPALHPWAGTADLVDRARIARGQTQTVSPVVELLHVRHHVRLINLSRPPEHHLPAPTARIVAWFSGRRAAEAV